MSSPSRCEASVSYERTLLASGTGRLLTARRFRQQIQTQFDEGKELVLTVLKARSVFQSCSFPSLNAVAHASVTPLQQAMGEEAINAVRENQGGK